MSTNRKILVGILLTLLTLEVFIGWDGLTTRSTRQSTKKSKMRGFEMQTPLVEHPKMLPGIYALTMVNEPGSYRDMPDQLLPIASSPPSARVA